MAPTIASKVGKFVGPYAQRADTLSLHLSRVLQTSAGIDTTLCTVCYTLTLLHSQLTRVLAQRYEKLAFGAISKSLASPGETLLASLSAPSTRLAATCASVKALADLISDFRIFFRLWGLVTIYAWGRETYTTPPRDPVVKILLWAQIGASATFQVLENAAYLAVKGVLRGEKWERRQTRWDALSNRWWMAQVVLELLRLARVRQMQFNEEFGAQTVGEGEKEVKVQSQELERKWWNEVYLNAGWLPLTLHWSFEDPAHSPVSETWIGICGMLAGVSGFRKVWEETA